MKRLKELLTKLLRQSLFGRKKKQKVSADGGPRVPLSEDDGPIPSFAVPPSAPPKRKGRVKLRIRAKQLNSDNSVLGKFLDLFAGVGKKVRLPAPLAALIGKGRLLPLLGRRLGRIADEGIGFPYIFAREIRLPRLVSRLLLAGPARIPLIGRLPRRLAEGHITTPDFRRGATRLRFALVGGAVFMVVIFVATVQFPLTTNPVFCGSCHTMRPQFYNWADSSHSRVTCYACHVSPGLWWLIRDHLVDGPMGLIFEAEIYAAGIKGGLGTAYWDDATSLNSSSHAGQVAIKSARCLRCHDMATRRVTATKGIKIDHMAHLRRNIACTWCHNRITHWRVPNHENFMTGQACFRCHYESPDNALLGNGAPKPSEEQLLMGLGLPVPGEHGAEEEGAAHGAEEGEEGAAEGEHGAEGEHEDSAGHREKPASERMRYSTEDAAGEIVTPEKAKEIGLTGSFHEGALASSRGHGDIGEEIRQAYHPHTPIGEKVKEVALSLPIIGLPEVHIDYSKYAASSACNVCHVRGKL